MAPSLAMLGFSGILLLGIGAQWLAWRLRIPSILLLLLAGFAVGPFSGHALLNPDELLGEELHGFVALAVAVILFEGGLSLRFRDLGGAGKAVTSLVFLGPPLTMALITLLAHSVLGFEWESSALVGAILVVTGPTVVGPLLRHVRPTGQVGKVVRWEGIVTDPIGAIFAVLVFEAFLHGPKEEAIAYQGLARAIFGGAGLGAVGGLVVVLLLQKKWIPDFLHAPSALAVAVACFGGANEIQEESGLLAVTVMGMFLANQRRVVVEHIVEFKENLRVILVSLLFLLLAARIPLEEFTRVDWHSVSFVALLILVVRPLVILLTTLGTGISWAEKAFIAWMAPRGIVAAAVASVFALRLDPERFPLASVNLVPVIFLVIIVTVLVYGLTAAPLAKRLGLSKGAPQGVLFVGAQPFARAIAKGLQGAGIEVLLVDTNHKEAQAARIEGLRAHYGNVLVDDFEHHTPLDGIGNLLCLTYNDQVNALACLQFVSILGRSQVYQVAPDEESGSEELPAHLRGQVLWSVESTYWELQKRFRDGAVVKATRLSDEFNLDDFLATHAKEGCSVIPLFAVNEDGRLRIALSGQALEPVAGETLLALVG